MNNWNVSFSEKSFLGNQNVLKVKKNNEHKFILFNIREDEVEEEIRVNIN